MAWPSAGRRWRDGSTRALVATRGVLACPSFSCRPWASATRLWTIPTRAGAAWASRVCTRR
eukprot:5635756-Pyramimonas_sp.AAC.1